MANSRFGFGSGGSYLRSILQWQPTLTSHNPNPPITINDAPAATIFAVHISVAPQFAYREYAGYAAIFGAVAALLAPLPQKAIAHTLRVETHQAVIAEAQPRPQVWGTPFNLIPVVQSAVTGRLIVVVPQQVDDPYAKLWGPQPVGDIVAAANYTVGTHQAAIAASQPAPQVWGLFEPPVADKPFGRLLVVAPQEDQTQYSQLWGTNLVSVEQPGKTLFAAPQQNDNLVALLWGLQPDGIDVPPPKTLVSAPQQADDPYAKLWGLQPDGIDVPPPQTLTAAPEQIGISYAKLWGPQPFSIDTRSPTTLFAAPQQVDIGHAEVWGLFPPALLDAPNPKTLFGWQEPLDFGSALLWGPQPAGIDVKPPTTQVSAPEQFGISYAKVWGTPVAAVVAAEFIGRPIVSAQEQADSAYALIWGTPVAAVPTGFVGRPIIAAPEQTDSAYALVWGPFVVFVPGTDPIVGRFRFSYRQEDLDRAIGDVSLCGIATGDVIIPSPGFEWIIRARRRKGR